MAEIKFKVGHHVHRKHSKQGGWWGEVVPYPNQIFVIKGFYDRAGINFLLLHGFFDD